MVYDVGEWSQERDGLFLAHGTLSYTFFTHPRLGEKKKKKNFKKKMSMYANEASKQEEEEEDGRRAVWMMKLVEFGPVSI